MTRLAAAVAVLLATLPGRASQPPAGPSGLTAIPGIKVGHHTLTQRPTGCTVILTAVRDIR